MAYEIPVPSELIENEEECKKARSNPECPYIGRINKMETDIQWLKKGYWVQIIVGLTAVALQLVFR